MNSRIRVLLPVTGRLPGRINLNQQEAPGDPQAIAKLAIIIKTTAPTFRFVMLRISFLGILTHQSLSRLDHLGDSHHSNPWKRGDWLEYL